MLAIGAFSYGIVRLVNDAHVKPAVWMLFGVATILVANVLPRQAINRLFFVDALTRWSGYTYFLPSEAYQFFGFPFFGLVCLVAALWLLRPDAAR